MKKVLLLLLSSISLLVSAQKPAKELFNESSASYRTFWKAVRSDSILSLRSAKGYVPTFFYNFAYQGTFQFRLKGKQFALLGGTAAITLAMIHIDQELDFIVRPVKGNNKFIAAFSPHVTELGDYYGYIVVAGFGSYSILFHNYRGFRTALLASQAGATAGLWIRVGKMISSRMRPEATYKDREYNLDHWFGPFAQFDPGLDRGIAAFDAFPSGHTGAAFAMATVFAEQYKDYKAVPVAMYSVAGLVAITRLIEHQHWVSDIFLGGVMGYLCGKQVVKNELRQFPDYKLARRNYISYFYPYAYEGKTGIGWKMVF